MNATAVLFYAVLVAVGLVLFVAGMRTMSRRRTPRPAVDSPARTMPVSRPGRDFWTSPRWNAIGVLAGLLSALVGLIGLLK